MTISPTDPSTSSSSGVDPSTSTSSTTGTEGTTTTPTTPPATTDTITSSGGTRMTIMAYAAAISEPQLKLKDILGQIEQQYHLSSKDLMRALERRARDARNLKSEINSGTPELSTKESTQNGRIDVFNQKIAAFNSSLVPLSTSTQDDQNAVNTMNQAIASFNAGTMDETQFEASVNTYNSYVATRNPQIATYNTDANTYNTDSAADVQRINELMTLLQMPPVPPKTAQTIPPLSTITPATQPAPPAPPVPNFTPPITALAVPSATLTPLTPYDPLQIPAASDSINALYRPLMDSIDKSITTVQKQKELNDAFHDKMRTIKRSAKPFKPDAYVYSQGKVASSGSATASIGLGSQLTQLDQANLQGLLSNSIYGATLHQYGENVTKEVSDELNRLSTDYLQTSALGAAVDGSGPGLGLSAQFGAIVSGNLSTVDGQVAEIINSNPAFASLSPGERAELQASLSNSTQLSILLLAGFQISSALNAPGLIQQVLAKASPEVADTLSPPSVTELFKGLLTDNNLAASLKTDLEKIALSLGISPEVVGPTLQASLTSALGSSSDNSPNALYASLRAGFLANGLSEEQAGQLSDKALANLFGQLTHPTVTDSDLDAEVSGAAFSDSVKSSQINSSNRKSELLAEVIRQNANDAEDISTLRKEVNKLYEKLHAQDPSDPASTINTLATITDAANQDRIQRDAIQKDNINKSVTSYNLALEIIKNTALSSEAANARANDVLNSSLQKINDGNNEASLRYQVQQELVRSGTLDASAANDAANSFALSLNSQTASSITDLGVRSELSDTELAAQVNKRAADLGASPEVANKLEQLFSVNNPLSLTNQISDKIAQAKGHNVATTNIYTNFHDLMRPENESLTNTYLLTNKIMDPANLFTSSQISGGPMFENNNSIRRSIDIQI